MTCDFVIACNDSTSILLRFSTVTAFHISPATSSGTTHINEEGLKSVAKYRNAQAGRDFVNVKNYSILLCDAL